MAIAVVVLIPVMIVLDPAPLAFPVAVVEPPTIISGFNPTRTAVGRPSPIPVVPLVVVSNGIPISLNPYKVWTGTHGDHMQNTRWRRRADLNSNRDLCAKTRRAGQKRYDKCGQNEGLHASVRQQTLSQIASQPKWQSFNTLAELCTFGASPFTSSTGNFF